MFLQLLESQFEMPVLYLLLLLLLLLVFFLKSLMMGILCWLDVVELKSSFFLCHDLKVLEVIHNL